MTFFSIDIETDGPAPGLYSMLSIGVVAVRPGLNDTFYSEMKPLPGASSNPKALAVSGLNLNALTQNAPEPSVVLEQLTTWLVTTSSSRPVFIADNPAFDFAFVSSSNSESAPAGFN